MKKRGSILIWTMFMSLFIVSFFVAYQSSFLSFISNTESLGNNINDYNIINSSLGSLKNNLLPKIKLKKYLITSNDFDGVGFSGSLRYNETTEYFISSTGGSISLQLNLIRGGPIEYNIISYDSILNNTLYDSGIIMEGNSSNVNLDKTKKFNIIAVHNLGGSSDFYLQRLGTNMLPPENYYTISKDYGSWQDYIRTEKITNFQLKTNSINYNKFSIFLNSSNYE